MEDSSSQPLRCGISFYGKPLASPTIQVVYRLVDDVPLLGDISTGSHPVNS
jgi:hypothetical protein